MATSSETTKKQQRIPGTEAKIHRDITKAAESYVDVRDARMKLTREEVEAKSLLAAAMRKHELTSYTDPDAELEVTFESTATEKLKVKRLGDDDGDE